MIIGKLASSIHETLTAWVVRRIVPVILSDEAPSDETIALDERVSDIKDNQRTAVALFIEFTV